MKRTHGVFIIICAVAALVATLVFVFLFLQTPKITNYPPSGARIVMLGDSLTVGIGASSIENGLVPLLEKRIGVSIINRGVSGNTTRDALLRLSQDVLAEKPDITIILLGGNDYLKRVPEKETFDNLRSIISQIQSGGSVVLLLGIRGGLLVDRFDDQFKALAHETGSLFVPNVLDNIFGQQQLMSDGIHPNDRGYEKIVDKIAPSVLGILPPTTGDTTGD